MLIIILIALLSIAYFEPPGGAGGIKSIGEEKQKEFTVTPLTKILSPSFKPYLEGKFYYEREIGRLKKETAKRDEIIEKLRIGLIEKEKKIKELEKKISEEKKEELKERTKIERVGKHEFTDLRER
jgi:hypothetical protein